jgi:signal transduction histidine kinase
MAINKEKFDYTTNAPSFQTEMHHRDNAELMGEIDFLLGSQDEKILDSFTEVFIAMAKFDFSQRVKFTENASPISFYLLSAINMLCEEYSHSAIQKSVCKTLLSTPLHDIDLLIVTDPDGHITIINQYGSKLATIEEKTLYGYGINTLIEDCSPIDILLQEGASLKNIPVVLKWNGERYAATATVSFSSRVGKMEAAIYKLKLP